MSQTVVLASIAIVALVLILFAVASVNYVTDILSEVNDGDGDHGGASH